MNNDSRCYGKRRQVSRALLRGLLLFTSMGVMAMDKHDKQEPLELRSPYGALSDFERGVILNKGTERPYTGKYYKSSEQGVYACRNCGAPLYSADDKFQSECGWPAFDDEIPGHVRRSRDADGNRVEITCARCGGHLGHVFTGEAMTAKDTRHCVNSVSLVHEGPDSARIRRAVFAGGCFWGVETLLASQPGVLAAVSGYAGGALANPSYRQVCAGNTGHAEAVQVFYDPTLTDFLSLCRYFLEIHDPTQFERQGPDIGSQYRSAIFYADDEQKRIATALLELLKKRGVAVQTALEPLGRFWNAETYHQDYYAKNGKQPYCHAWQQRFSDVEIKALAAELGLQNKTSAGGTGATTGKGETMSIYDFTVKTAADEDVPLSIYKGNVLLIVNVASKCGFTPQYQGLEELYKTYGGRGLVVLGFPCNQFKSQEPGSDAEIQQFCRLNYGVSFPVYAKIDVNGDSAHPLFKYLKEQKAGLLGRAIKWNFTKFLVGADGKVIDRYAPTTKPQDIAKDIEKALAAVAK